MSSVSKHRESLNSEFYKIMLKFSLVDLKNSVSPAFGDDELTWECIEKALLKYNLSTRKQDIARLLLEYTKPMRMEELQQIYGNLLLIDLMRNPQKKTWTAVNMRQENEIPADNEVVFNITRTFRDKSKRLNVYSDESQNIRWFIMIVSKKTRNDGTVPQKPVFIACPLNTANLFYSPLRMSTDLLKIVVKGLGYDNHKVMKLSGKDIFSLISLLDRRKNADQVRARTSLALKNNSDIIAVKSSRGIDFCQDKVRSEHAKEILGSEPIQLENLVVKVNSEWRGLRTVPEAEGEKLDISMKLSSKDIRMSLDELISRGVISQPYPGWLKEFLISGKNVLQIG